MRNPLPEYYRALRERFGARNWWPADSPFEVMVGAILTQNTAWPNVEKAVANLKSCGLLDPRKIRALDLPTLSAAIRPAGYFRVKAHRLKNFVTWYLKAYGGDLRRMMDVPTSRLREELLSVKGVGPETADSILLYALGRPSFVVDAYTYRVLTRHHLVPEDAGYDEMKDFFESRLPPDVPRYNDYHAQIVEVGKTYCRSKPRCEECPLRPFLP